jgi:hypothetical protein
MITESLHLLHEQANESFLGRVALRTSGIAVAMLFLEGVSYVATGNALSLPIDTAIGTVTGNSIFITKQQVERTPQA